MERELRDELEVPGHVVMIQTRTRADVIAEIRGIMDQYEKQGITKVRDLSESAKKTLRGDFDLLGISHDDLKGENR